MKELYGLIRASRRPDQQLSGNRAFSRPKQERLLRVHVPPGAEALLRIAGDEFAHAGVPGRRIAFGLVRPGRDVPATDHLPQEAAAKQRLSARARKRGSRDSVQAVVLEGFQGCQTGSEAVTRGGQESLLLTNTIV